MAKKNVLEDLKVENVKEILDGLNSALYLLNEKISKLDEVSKKQNEREFKIEEREADLKGKAQALDEREGNIKHIESVAEAQREAKKLTESARAMMTSANDKAQKLDRELAEITKKKVTLEKEQEDFAILQKKEIEAVQKERKELQEQATEVRMMKEIKKKLSK